MSEEPKTLVSSQPTTAWWTFVSRMGVVECHWLVASHDPMKTQPRESSRRTYLPGLRSPSTFGYTTYQYYWRKFGLGRSVRQGHIVRP